LDRDGIVTSAIIDIEREPLLVPRSEQHCGGWQLIRRTPDSPPITAHRRSRARQQIVGKRPHGVTGVFERRGNP
jgi:hypothetical protein